MADVLPLPVGNIGGSIAEGLKTGADWAQAKQMNNYRMQELQKQYTQLQQQQAQHKYQVMSKVGDYMWTIASLPPKQRAPYFRLAEAQAQSMGVDISAWKGVINDPSFQIDVAGPLKQVLSGMKANDPNQIAQAWPQFNAAMKDPIFGRQLLSQATSAITQQTKQNNQFQNQSSLVDQKAANSASTQSSKAQQTYQLKLAADANYKKAVAISNGVDTAIQQLQDAGENPTQANAAGITLARLATGNQRMNQVEIKGLGKGSQAIIDRLTQFAQMAKSGTLTQTNIDSMVDFAKTLKQGAEQDIKNIGTNYAKQYSQLTGKPLDQSFKELTGNDYEPPAKSGASAHPDLSPDQIKQIKDGVKKFQDQGASPDQIKGALEKSFGRTFSDDDAKSFGLSIVPPNPSKPVAKPLDANDPMNQTQGAPGTGMLPEPPAEEAPAESPKAAPTPAPDTEEGE